MATTEREFQIAPIVPESVMHNTKVIIDFLPRHLIPPTTKPHRHTLEHETHHYLRVAPPPPSPTPNKTYTQATARTRARAHTQTHTNAHVPFTSIDTCGADVRAVLGPVESAKSDGLHFRHRGRHPGSRVLQRLPLLLRLHHHHHGSLLRVARGPRLAQVRSGPGRHKPLLPHAV